MNQRQHNDPAKKAIFQAGDQPGAGIYRCLERPSFVATIDDNEALPPCTSVAEGHKVSYRRVVDERNAITVDQLASSAGN